MEKLKQNWWLMVTGAIVLVVFIIYYVSGDHNWGLAWTEKPWEILLKLVVGLTITAALIDQLISVFLPDPPELKDKISNARLEASITKENYNRLKEDVRTLERERIVNPVAAADSTTRDQKKLELQATLGTLKANQEQVKEANQQRHGRIRRIAFAISLVVALGGIQVLTPLLDLGTAPPISKYLIWFCDLVLTAALLSGGTSGVRMFVDTLKDALDKNGTT